MTNDSSCDCVSETIDDPRASPSDNACKTNPKVRVNPFPEVGILDPFPAAVRGVAGRWAPVEVDGWIESPSNPPSSTSASNSTVETFGESGLEASACGPE